VVQSQEDALTKAELNALKKAAEQINDIPCASLYGSSSVGLEAWRKELGTIQQPVSLIKASGEPNFKELYWPCS
jgi:hypothetical protein